MSVLQYNHYTKEYDDYSVAEVAAIVVYEITKDGISDDWHCHDSGLRELVRKKLEHLNIKLKVCSDNSDRWALDERMLDR